MKAVSAATPLRRRGRRVSAPRGAAAAGAVVAECVDAILRMVDGHFVGQGGDRYEEVACGDQRLQQIAGCVAVAFGVDFFKVQRPMV